MPMSTRGLLLIFIATTVASACSKKQSEQFIEGVNDPFCVPAQNSPNSYWWIPEDTAKTPIGFSFRNCKGVDSESSNCDSLGSVISGDVEPKSPLRVESWRNLRHGAIFENLASNSETRYELDKATGFFVMSNRDIWKDWLIWSGQKSADDVIGPEDSDLLIASCSEASEAPEAPLDSAKGMYVCRRYLSGPEYSVRYTFLSSRAVPVDIHSLDGEVLRRISNWKCPR